MCRTGVRRLDSKRCVQTCRGRCGSERPVGEVSHTDRFFCIAGRSYVFQTREVRLPRAPPIPDTRASTSLEKVLTPHACQHRTSRVDCAPRPENAPNCMTNLHNFVGGKCSDPPDSSSRILLGSSDETCSKSFEMRMIRRCGHTVTVEQSQHCFFDVSIRRSIARLRRDAE